MPVLSGWTAVNIQQNAGGFSSSGAATKHTLEVGLDKLNATKVVIPRLQQLTTDIKGAAAEFWDQGIDTLKQRLEALGQCTKSDQKFHTEEELPAIDSHATVAKFEMQDAERVMADDTSDSEEEEGDFDYW